MASLSKRGNTYYVNWRDEQGIVRRRSTGCQDKAEATRVMRQIEKDQQRDRENPFAKWRKVPLNHHAEDYRKYQLSIGTTKKQVNQIHSRITRIIEAGKIRYATDLTVSRVTTTIDGLRMLPQSQVASRRPIPRSPCGPRNSMPRQSNS